MIRFPFDHELRSKVDNNWHITPTKIAQFFTPEQQAMVEEIFKGLHNPNFADKVMLHMKETTKRSATTRWRCSESPAAGSSNSC